MPLDPEYLRRHYAALSDDALLAVDRRELVDAAQRIFDEELVRRELTPRGGKRKSQAPHIQPERTDATQETDAGQSGDEEAPDWLEDAASVYSYTVLPGSAPAPDAEDARDALEAAGIPCYLDVREIPPETKPASSIPVQEWRLMVPGDLNMRATSVLERDIFNPDFEAEWRTHLEALSDEELRAMKPEVAFCGLFDRIERVNRVYSEESKRRGL